MEVEYVTHASLRLRAPAAALLLDPFYFLDEIESRCVFNYPPRVIDPVQLGAIDFVFSSHVHPDHAHEPTLARLKDQIGQVLIPDGRPGLRARYQRLGFADVRPLENGRTVRLADGLAVTCFWSDPVDSLLVIEADGAVIAHLNDCAPDAATCAEIGRRFRVDYAFIGYTRAQDLYPLLLDRRPVELLALARAREAEWVAAAVEIIEAMRPAAIVPYAMTVTFHDPDQHALNGYGRLVPQEFCDRVRAALPDLRALVMHPGDVLDTASGRVAAGGCDHPWGTSLAEYLANVAAYARSAGLPRLLPGDPAAAAARMARHLERRLRDHPVQAVLAGRLFALRVSGESTGATIVVDPDARTVGAPAPAGRPLVEIALPASLADAIVAGESGLFAAVQSFRVRFRGGAALSPAGEVTFDTTAFVALMAPELLLDYLGVDGGGPSAAHA